MQYLTMPFKKQMMLCGYKVDAYTKHWGYRHFGVDISTIQGGAGKDPTIYASGNGTVVASGYDNGVGGALVIIYPDCYIHHSGKIEPLVARYFHMRTVYVKAGEKVEKGQKIGVEGNEQTGDYHLHLEFDVDTAFPCLSPQVKGANIIKNGVDSCINPSYVLHIGEGQEIVPPTYAPKWLNPEDKAIPKVPDDVPLAIAQSQLKAKEQKVEELTKLLEAEIKARLKNEQIIKDIKKLLNS